MSGRRLILGFVGFLVVFAAALIWFQFFAFYQRQSDIETISIDGRTVRVTGYQGIDASSSPLKLRACFRMDPADVANLAPATDATPLVGHPAGFDTLIAIYPDGEGYLWRQLNGEIE